MYQHLPRPQDRLNSTGSSGACKSRMLSAACSSPISMQQGSCNKSAAVITRQHLVSSCLCPVHLAQMPTGTGKTITLLSLITSYQLAHPEVMGPGQMQLIGLRSCSQ